MITINIYLSGNSKKNIKGKMTIRKLFDFLVNLFTFCLPSDGKSRCLRGNKDISLRGLPCWNITAGWMTASIR